MRQNHLMWESLVGLAPERTIRGGLILKEKENRYRHTARTGSMLAQCEMTSNILVFGLDRITFSIFYKFSLATYSKALPLLLRAAKRSFHKLRIRHNACQDLQAEHMNMRIIECYSSASPS